MKRILDSFIKNIVRQSLNENYGLLNEGSDPKCPPSAFCLNDGSLLRAQKLSKTLSPVGNGTVGQELINTLKFNCNRLNYGPANENLAISVVEIIGLQYSNTNVDENKVKREILKLNYPEWCMAIELAQQKGFADGDNFWNIKSVGEGDYGVYVANPSLQVLRNTIIKSDKLKKDYDEKRSTNKTKWDEELKKSGWATRDEWKKAGWKPKPKEYTIGGGGKNTVGVSFTGLECILEHPALVNTQVKIPRGVGYKLNTGNKTIDFYVYGVAKRDDTTDATDEGVLYREDTGISIPINCDYKFLQHSLSTTPWNYNAVIDNNGKIALTTDPKYNNNIQIESIKGFRHNLLTETDLKIGSKGAEVESIQKKLSVPVTKVFDEKTKAAVIEFQTNMGIVPVTGIVDNKTLKKINDYSVTVTPPSATEWRRDLKIGSVGVDVEAIQKKLNIPTKGGYKVGTENAVKSFQKKYGLLVTGIVDQTTFDKIMSMDAVGTADTYSGQKHNYKEGDWIRITPNDNDNQFSANNGYFRITKIVDSYTVVIEAPLVASGTTGGSTQRVLFGENAKNGTQEVIKGDRNNSGTRSKGRTRSKVRTSTGNDVETKRREIRNSEYCDSLRKIKKHLNLKVDCKKYQSTLNKIMLALTGGVEIKPVTPVAPVSPVAPVAPITPSGNVTIY
tara:strand:- start:9 stop:2027 length:2019 start_codon:yes stop_codon:yes gene_type:complete